MREIALFSRPGRKKRNFAAWPGDKPLERGFTMRNSHRVTALSVCLVILASIFAVACTDPSARPANSPDTSRASERRER
jgi:hypothetical protein